MYREISTFCWKLKIYFLVCSLHFEQSNSHEERSTEHRAQNDKYTWIMVLFQWAHPEPQPIGSSFIFIMNAFMSFAWQKNTSIILYENNSRTQIGLHIYFYFYYLHQIVVQCSTVQYSNSTENPFVCRMPEVNCELPYSYTNREIWIAELKKIDANYYSFSTFTKHCYPHWIALESNLVQCYNHIDCVLVLSYKP